MKRLGLGDLGAGHSRTQSPSYARSTERDEGLWPNPYSELASDWLVLTPDIACFLTIFLWYPVMDLARASRRTARKKGSGYENGGGGRGFH